ncbi:hypothetical protein [Stieleria varia]|uniref:Uncharacterized protein n=1 Tax=Stieleria varia TaxID=2528005 RepID=A0A5C6AST0_9BACT|nr:hypothetical protein [Stieleria varia]TWU02750.1 hypothetical protein Pla52n_38090 [Stieleria varia]
MKDRFAVRDLLLVFSASCVLTLALWPRSPARQIVHLETSSGHWETRSLATNDPRLELIGTALLAKELQSNSPDVAVATWRRELDSFYRANPPRDANGSVDTVAATASISDDVVIASYEAAVSETTLSPAAVSSPIVEPSTQSAPFASENTNSSGIAVQLGETIPRSLPQFAFHAAFLVGVLMASGYKHWTMKIPAVPKRRRQPVAVRIRQYSLASLASLGGFACILLVF